MSARSDDLNGQKSFIPARSLLANSQLTRLSLRFTDEQGETGSGVSNGLEYLVGKSKLSADSEDIKRSS